MARIITPEQIKHGDKIRLVQEFTVGKSNGDFKDSPLDSDGEVWSRESNDYVYVQDDSFTIELVERPNPEIPEGMGHIIKVYDDLGKEGLWLTQEGGYITSARNVRVTRDYFLEDFIKSVGYSFEVIA